MKAEPVEVHPRLSADDIRAASSRRIVVGREIVIFEETDSTNDLARRAGDDGIAEGLVIFAESQRAGRGTQGRQWMSPPRRGLWFSILLRPGAMPVERWPELTFCAALAVAETAELATGQSARIKWPNDVMLCGWKIAGILVECHHRERPGFVVIGIGLNVLQQPEDFAPELRDRAASLAMVSQLPVLLERHRVAADLLDRLDRYYSRWTAGFPSLMNLCEQRGCIPPSEAAKAEGGPLSKAAFQKPTV